VYFVLALESGRVKIGVSSNPPIRFQSLQTGNSEPTQLLGWIECEGSARGFERELHDCFAAWRLHGEWFCGSSGLAAFAEEVRDPGTEPSAWMLEPVEEPPVPRRPQIPDGVEAPKGNSRKAILARYKLARGLD
jgi:hypothetical protein